MRGLPTYRPAACSAHSPIDALQTRGLAVRLLVAVGGALPVGDGPVPLPVEEVAGAPAARVAEAPVGLDGVAVGVLVALGLALEAGHRPNALVGRGPGAAGAPVEEVAVVGGLPVRLLVAVGGALAVGDVPVPLPEEEVAGAPALGVVEAPVGLDGVAVGVLVAQGLALEARQGPRPDALVGRGPGPAGTPVEQELVGLWVWAAGGHRAGGRPTEAR